MLRSSYAYVYAHQRFRCLCLFHRVNQALEFKVLGVNLNAIIIECCKIDAIFIM
jgi:hypothetical protein